VLFWILIVALVMLVMTAVYLPLLRAPKAEPAAEALERALIAELADIEANGGGRYVSDAEAKAARAEVARRLFALRRDTVPEATAAPRWAMLFALLPLIAVPLYLSLGAPEYPDQPLATRIDREGREIDQLITRVEERLRQVPDDARGWALVAPIYARSGRNAEALNAYEQAIKHFTGPAAERAKLIADRAEVMVISEEGKVSPQSLAAFNDALAADPANQKAQFYLAVHIEQNAGADAAKAAWTALIAKHQAENPGWLDLARQRLAALDPQGAPGPTQADIDAAAQLSNPEQRAMIEGMVANLAAKLEADPSDAAGWARLIRSRFVLGDKEQAAKDMQTARSHFAEGTEERTKLESFAANLGL
jgi:cytochrome c-type biogenesis protein CcmH